MKKTILILLLAFLAPIFANAQSPAGRLPNTIVADVLAQMPAQNQETYNQMMEDLISSGNEGLDILMGKMLPGPKDDNTKASYAIGGLTFYVTTPGKESARQMVTKSLINALEKTSYARIKEFYIRQLQIAGKDDAIDVLKYYAQIQDICQVATNALVELGSPKAKETISSIVPQIPLKAVAAQAVGDYQLSEHEALLLSWLNSGNDVTQRSVLYGLSLAGGVASLKPLRNEVIKVDYSYELTNAINAYYTLLERLPASESKKDLKKLLKNSDEAVRSAAIQMFAAANGPEALPFILKAMNDPSRRFRNAALASVCCKSAEEISGSLIKKMAKADDISRTDITNWLGIHKIQDATSIIISNLNSQNAELRDASITALTRLNNDEAGNAIINLLTSGDSTVVNSAKEALLWFDGAERVVPMLLGVLPSASENGKIAIMEIFQARHAANALNEVLAYTQSTGPVADAALRALPNVVTKNQFDLLSGMLESASGTRVEYIQKAIGTAISGMSPDEALAKVKAKMGSNRALYYPVLSYIGTPAAFALVQEGIASSNATERSAAIKTAANWNDFAAHTTLLGILSDKNLASYHDAALEGYIRLLGKVNFNDVQKLIYLRNALDVVSTAEQKNILLGRIGTLTTFNALMLAGGYLSDPATEQAAGTALMNIALRDKTYSFWGEPVKELLKKFLTIRKGGDAQYDKAAIEKYLAEAPGYTGFVSVFNGKDLTGWKGLVENPIARAKMKPADLAKAQVKADEIMREGWEVRDGVLHFTGHGDNLCTDKMYGDFEMYVDWKIIYKDIENDKRDGDAGIYLRGTPQIQIWDTIRKDVGAEVGSGGLYNNSVNPSKPLVLADNAINDWNTFYIKMVGERVTVYLNGILVTDNVILENYWDRRLPIFPIEQIELQAHGSLVAYRDIYIKELPKKEPFQLSAEEKAEGFKILFDGESMHEWVGNTTDYVAENGTITLYPGNGGGGNLYTKKEYGDFIFRFDFKLTPGANNGLGIRTPMEGDAAYVGTELQILDNDDPIYKDLAPYQYHGSAYGIIAAKRGYLKPVGEWNSQEVYLRGNKIRVTLNGNVILEGDLAEASKNGTIDGKDHPGLKNLKGHLAFLGHGSVVSFRNMRIKEL